MSDGDTSARWRALSDRLDELLNLEDPSAQDDRLAELRQSDPELARELAELLAAMRAGDSMLDSGGDSAAAILAGVPAPTAAIPATIGPWRIVGRLGEGGMGAVFAGERHGEGFVQRAAVKVLRSGFATPALRERFLVERRILAGLEHPGIARLLDGGVADDGTPYLALERIDGAPITEACSARRASVEERLRLFLEVCAAVEHAHRNLVVHRDLKPSNVLVDREGRARLLDFGIAKLLDAPAEPESPPTLLRALTPRYAAPEQITGGTITTATDVYALGVLLFELLAGRSPYGLADGSPYSVEQAVVAAEPARLPLAASIDPSRPEGQRLARRLSGDLERIVQRAMAKEPERRYPTVGKLADDLHRHLEGRPVAARGDSLGYRAGKFLHRHRWGVSLSAFAAVALVAALATALAQARRAEREAARARAQAELAESSRDFLAGLFGSADPNVALGRVRTDREMLADGVERIDRELAGKPELQTPLFAQIAAVYLQLGEYARAEPLARRVVAAEIARSGEASADAARARLQLAEIRYQQNAFEEAVALDRAALPRLESQGDEADRERALDGRVNLAKAAFALGRFDEAAVELDRAAERARATFGPASVQLFRVQSARTSQLLNAGRIADGAEAASETVALARELFAPEAPQRLTSELNQVVALSNLGRRDEARRALVGLPERLDRVLGPEYQDTLVARRLEARLAASDGDFATALATLDRVAATLRAEAQPQLLGYTLVQAAAVALAAGDPARADALAREAEAALGHLLGEDHVDTAYARSSRGAALLSLGRYAEAEAELARAAHDEIEDGFATSDFHADTLERIGALELRQGRAARARESLEAALAIRRSNSPEGSRGTATTLLLLARALDEPERSARCRELLAEAAALLDAALGPAHPQRLEAHRELARCAR